MAVKAYGIVMNATQFVDCFIFSHSYRPASNGHVLRYSLILFQFLSAWDTAWFSSSSSQLGIQDSQGDWSTIVHLTAYAAVPNLLSPGTWIQPDREACLKRAYSFHWNDLSLIWLHCHRVLSACRYPATSRRWCCSTTVWSRQDRCLQQSVVRMRVVSKPACRWRRYIMQNIDENVIIYKQRIQ